MSRAIATGPAMMEKTHSIVCVTPASLVNYVKQVTVTGKQLFTFCSFVIEAMETLKIESI